MGDKKITPYKYSIGDRVLILQDPSMLAECAIPATNSMKNLCGSVATITNRGRMDRTNTDRMNLYSVAENTWLWSEDMFDGLCVEYDIDDCATISISSII